MEPYVASGVLGKMVEFVSLAVSSDKTRPALCGIHVILEPGYLRLVGCDGYVLHLAETEFEHEITATGTVDAGVLKAFAKQHAKQRERLALAADSQALGIGYYSKNPEGCEPVLALTFMPQKYLDWKDILTRCLSYQTLVFQPQHLIEALSGFRLKKIHKPSIATLHINGKVGLELPPGPERPGEVRVALNLVNLHRALAAFEKCGYETDTMTLGYKGPKNPFYLSRETYDWRSLSLIMPMNITR